MAPGEVIGYYYESHVYFDLFEQNQHRTSYREGVIPVTVEHCSKSALKLLDTTIHERNAERTAWLVPAPFCCMIYINDDMYLTGDRAPYMIRTSHPRQNKVVLVQVLSPWNQSELKLYGII